MDFGFLENEDITVEEIRENMTTVVNAVSELESTVETLQNENEKLKETNLKLYTQITSDNDTEPKEDEEEHITLEELFE